MSHLMEMQENILIGIFGKEGGNIKNYEATISAGIDGFSKPSYDFLWQAQKRHFSKTREMITWPICKSYILANKKLTPDIKTLYLTEVRKLFKEQEYRRVINNKLVKFSISELSTIKRYEQFTNIVQNHFINVNNGEIDDLDDALKQTVSQLMNKLIYSTQTSDYELVNYSESFAERQELRRREKEEPETYKKFQFGYRELQEVYPRGIRPGDLGLISGVSGVGKSIETIDIAKTASYQGLKAAIVISENSVFQTCGRLDASITGVEYDLIQGYGFSEKDRKEFERVFYKKLNAIKGIRIIKVSPNNFTVLTINRALNELASKHGFKPDVVIIDSPDLMRPSIDIKFAGEHTARLQSTAVYWEIKTFAVDQQYIVFCTAQLTRNAAKKGGDVTAEDVAEDYNKIRIADFQIILYETVELALQNQMGKKIGKNRDGAKPVEGIIFMVDKSRMSFYHIDGSPNIFENAYSLNVTGNKTSSLLIPRNRNIIINNTLIPKPRAVMAAASN